jgi:hypothetical protein
VTSVIIKILVCSNEKIEFSSRVCAVQSSPFDDLQPLLFDLPPLGIFSRVQIWSTSVPGQGHRSSNMLLAVVRLRECW